MSRGLSEEEATTMVVSGFIEPLVKELPMEYAVEMNRLIQLANGRIDWLAWKKKPKVVVTRTRRAELAREGIFL